MRRCELYFHKLIKFKGLRESKKAILAEIHEVSGGAIRDLTLRYGAILKPIQVWLPKSWLRMGAYGQIWIWEKGLINTLKKLIEKRKGMIQE